jgi:hypothetical protein
MVEVGGQSTEIMLAVLLLPKRSCEGSIGMPFFSFFFSVFRLTPPHNLRKPSSSHFQGLKIIPYLKRSFSPFDSRLKNDVGAPPRSKGVKPLFDCITQPFLNRFKCMIYLNDGHTAL